MTRHVVEAWETMDEARTARLARLRHAEALLAEAVRAVRVPESDWQADQLTADVGKAWQAVKTAITREGRGRHD